jgi:glycosyltransferase involved in cell wall biosynthesis
MQESHSMASPDDANATRSHGEGHPAPVDSSAGLASERHAGPARSPGAIHGTSSSRVTDAPALTVVVPCYNEEENLPRLQEALDRLAAARRSASRLSFVLVDDGSTDRTWSEMERLFADDPRFLLVRHDRNRGLSAATLTGIAAADTEAVAVIDSDCSYDPACLEEMVPLLDPDVALVTASPYHPLGRVEGVPSWRILLSRTASRCYRLVLRNKLETYTSCFRVYRREALKGLRLRNEGFVGVAETLARLDLMGWRIVEHPMLLETRLFGQSKLRILRVIAGHVQLILEIAAVRAREFVAASAAPVIIIKEEAP